jgi:hypothetical protein
MTYQELAKQALAIQDASNLSGVVHAFSRCMDVLWAEARTGEGKGTDWVNTHPIVTLFVDKLASLNRTQGDNFSAVMLAYDKVRTIADTYAPETTPDGLVLNGEQVQALHRKYTQNPDGFATYEAFRDTAKPMICGHGAVIVHWCNMWLAIETDGHTHS